MLLKVIVSISADTTLTYNNKHQTQLENIYRSNNIFLHCTVEHNYWK